MDKYKLSLDMGIDYDFGTMTWAFRMLRNFVAKDHEIETLDNMLSV